MLAFAVPQLLRRSTKIISESTTNTILWGLVVLLGGIPTILLLLVTVVGIPLALLLLSLWLIALYVAKFFAAYAAGSYVMNRVTKKAQKGKGGVFLATTLGLAGYYVLRMVPLIGMLVRFITSVIGIGILVQLASKKPKKAMRGSTA